MFLLIRKISPYTNADLLLGIFHTDVKAQRARRQYISNLQSREWLDPYAQQAYRDDVDLEIDVQILSGMTIHGVTKQARTVYMVCKMAEAFGQIRREIMTIYADQELAEKHADQIDKLFDTRLSQGEATYPEYGEVFELTVDLLDRHAK